MCGHPFSAFNKPERSAGLNSHVIPTRRVSACGLPIDVPTRGDVRVGTLEDHGDFTFLAALQSECDRATCPDSVPQGPFRDKTKGSRLASKPPARATTVVASG